MNFEEKIIERLKRLEREVERLRVKESPDMSSYLGISAKAADSDKLDGLDSTAFGRPVFLAAPLTSTAWDGDAFSTTAKTKIDLSVVFGVPAGVKAVNVSLTMKDSGSENNETFLILSPDNVTYNGVYTYTGFLPNDTVRGNSFVLPCDSNGDIYYQIKASGTGTMTIYLVIYGYWL